MRFPGLLCSFVLHVFYLVHCVIFGPFSITQPGPFSWHWCLRMQGEYCTTHGREKRRNLTLSNDTFASTAILFCLNFYMAKRMITFFNVRMSLWSKAFVESFSTASVIVYLSVVVVLNTAGVALFEFKPSESNHVSTAISLVQISAGFLFLLGLLLLGTVLSVRVSAESPKVPRLTARTVVFFTGVGLLTVVAQLVRFVSSFYIWKDNSANTRSEAILSKPDYYITGMGLEILVMVLYASARIDLLFALTPSLTSMTNPSSTKSASSR